jgi:hypothetical protein
MTTNNGGARQTVKADKRNAEIAGRVDGTGPNRIVQRCAEQTDHCRVDTAHYRLRIGAASPMTAARFSSARIVPRIVLRKLAARLHSITPRREGSFLCEMREQL